MFWSKNVKPENPPQPDSGTLRIVKSNDHRFIIQRFSSYDGWQCIGESVAEESTIRELFNFLVKSEASKKSDKDRQWIPI